MKTFRLVSVLVLMAGVSACGSTTVTRNAPFEAVPSKVVPDTPEGYRTASLPRPAPDMRTAPAARYKVVDFEIKVPQDLTVSEANMYHPYADIVWREDPYGNRKEQVGKIFQASLERSRDGLEGAQEVKVEITVSRFHALTEKARYSVGGRHTIDFLMVVRDARTGAVLQENPVHLDFHGYGGRKALEAERQGITQKVRITQHLARAIRAELTLPGGWNDQDDKLDTALSQI
ncbi:DUF6778 family protein [Tropicibacter alexandrii]|uniref:DUF6778 family protein n=1 Tax=Tropicibacter alexandrii TaxID=2267683 RepID=UPI000EF4664B|nr:DUF6778 family protein [Tropicibacter alexandrii]